MLNADQVIDGQSQHPVETSTSQSSGQTTEKMLSQSEVNDLIGRKKHEAYEKGKNETRAEYERANHSSNSNVTQQGMPQSSFGGMAQLSQDQIRELISKEVEQVTGQLEAKRNQSLYEKQLVDDFTNKMLTAKEQDPEFVNTVEPVITDPAFHNYLLPIVNRAENTADIIREFSRNPGKMASALATAAISPKQAERVIREISESIKANKNAQNPSIREPLSRINPSTVGTDNGSMTITELRKQPWLRG